MKLSFLFFIGLIAVLLSAFYIINPNEFQISNFNEVFAQSEGKNKNFEDAKTIHSSETNTNLKSANNNSQVKNFDDVIISQSNDTSITPDNKNKGKTFLPGRLSTSENPKIHSAITHILENANPKAIAKIYGASIDKDHLFVYVYLAENQNIPSDIEILAKDKNIIKSKLNLSQIKSLANLDSVEKITLPVYAVFYDHITSEGVEFSMADSIHAAGFNGTGIKVMVIDDSFIVTNPEISNNIGNTMWGTGCADIACGQTDGDSHGTAVADIVVDMAPGVNLWLYAIEDSVDFANAVEHAITNDVDIITASLGFPNLWGDVWYRDGTSRVAEWVDWAKGNGTLFTVAAGNQGDEHYSDVYVPLNATELEPDSEFLSDFEFFGFQSVMTFNNSATGNMKACLPVTNNRDLYTFRWNATIPTDQDYDPLLYSSNMTDFLGGLLIIQDGSPNTLPMENFTSIVEVDGCLVVGSFNSTENHRFHIEVGNNTLNIPDDDIHRLGSIDTPADARGSLSVGAVNFNTTPTNYSDDFLEPFSSQGPTDDGRPKPEICGPDGTITDQTVLTTDDPDTNLLTDQFFGTSGSTPHIAGAAALLLDQNSNLSVDELKQKLIGSARFDSDFAVDNKCGSGSLRLVLDATVTITKTANGGDEIFDFTTTSTDPNLDGNFTGNGGFVIDTSVNDIVTFTGLSPDVTYTITELAEPGWKFDLLSCIGGTTVTDITDTTVTLDPDPGEQIDCTYSNSKIISCTPPGSGDWTITESCILNSNHSLLDGDVIVQSNSLLTIPNGVTLSIEFDTHNLTVEFGSGVLIKFGGAIDTGHGPDSDSDGVPDASDNCPLTANADQLDTDMDSMGDACDADDDNDTVLDGSDNCPLTPNTNQNDLDSDGTGDACDSETIITSNTILTTDTSLGGDLVVEAGAVLTINPGVTLDIDFTNKKILVKFGGGILIKSGGTIT